MCASLILALVLVGSTRPETDEYNLTEEIVLHPVDYGPRITRPPALPRTPAEVFGRVADRSEALRQCYRWGRFRRQALGRVALDLTISVDSSGRASAVRADQTPPEAVELAPCLADVLTGQRVGEYTPL